MSGRLIAPMAFVPDQPPTEFGSPTSVACTPAVPGAVLSRSGERSPWWASPGAISRPESVASALQALHAPAIGLLIAPTGAQARENLAGQPPYARMTGGLGARAWSPWFADFRGAGHLAGQVIYHSAHETRMNISCAIDRVAGPMRLLRERRRCRLRWFSRRPGKLDSEVRAWRLMGLGTRHLRKCR